MMNSHNEDKEKNFSKEEPMGAILAHSTAGQ